MDTSLLKTRIKKILNEALTPDQVSKVEDKYNSIYSGMLKGNKKKLMKYIDPKFNRPNPDAMAMGRAINLVKKDNDKEEMNETLKLGVKYDLNGETGFIRTGGSNDPKDWMFNNHSYLSVEDKLTPLEKQPGKYDGAFDMGHGKGHHIDEESVNEAKYPEYIVTKDDWKKSKFPFEKLKNSEFKIIIAGEGDDRKYMFFWKEDGEGDWEAGNMKKQLRSALTAIAKRKLPIKEEVNENEAAFEHNKARAGRIMKDLFGPDFEFDYTYKLEGDRIIIHPEGYNDDGTLFDMKDVHKEKIIKTFRDKMPSANAKPNMDGGITVYLKESLNREKGLVKEASWDEIAMENYGVSYDELNYLEQEWVRDKMDRDRGVMEEVTSVNERLASMVREVYSEKQRRWACAQDDPKFDEMCKDTAISKKKIKEYSIMEKEDLTKSEKKKLKKVSSQLKKSVKAHDKQSKIIDKALKETGMDKAKKNMDDYKKQNRLTELIKDALKNPKKADLNKDGKLSDYEKKRGAAIEKSMQKESYMMSVDSNVNSAVLQALSVLKHADIDGETMQYILEELGMDEQMWKQLNVKYGTP